MTIRTKGPSGSAVSPAATMPHSCYLAAVLQVGVGVALGVLALVTGCSVRGQDEADGRIEVEGNLGRLEPGLSDEPYSQRVVSQHVSDPFPAIAVEQHGTHFVIEAEEYRRNLPSLNHAWSPVADSDASGGYAMRVGPDTNTGGSARLDFLLSVPECSDTDPCVPQEICPGGRLYNVLVRGKGKDNKADSVYVTVNHQAPASGDGISWPASESSRWWGWGYSTISDPATWAQVCLPFPTEEKKTATISLLMREDGTSIDKLVLWRGPLPSEDEQAVVKDRSNACLSRAAFALAAYKSNSAGDPAIADADLLIQQIHAVLNFRTNVGAEDLVENEPCYWALPYLVRIYADAALSSKMSVEARASLANVLWRFIEPRSKITEAEAATSIVRGSENHAAMRASAYLLISEALYSAGGAYDADLRLDDGHTLEEHMVSWRLYWGRYFRERAQEGIGIEVASPIYDKYSMMAYYNVRDLHKDIGLTDLAERFITLFWADVAQDYLTSVNVRGGAAVRVYKDKSLTRGTRWSLRDWACINEWPQNDCGTGASHPAALIPALSDYRPPDLVTSMARATKEPYQYISRRPGRVIDPYMGDGVEPVYRLDFPSHIRRYSYVTPEYVVGTMTYDPGWVYSQLATQNRAMGVMFASHVNARVMVVGNGTGAEGRTGHREINGSTWGNTAIIARDPEAFSNDGTRLFISYGDLWNNLAKDENGLPKSEGGWYFTHNTDAYLGFRLVSGGLVKHSVEDGKMLDFEDKDSPVVLQLGRAVDYASFAAFKTSVIENEFYCEEGEEQEKVECDEGEGQLVYVGEDDSKHKFSLDGSSSPMVCDPDCRTPSLDPAKTYDSPYIQSSASGDTVKVRLTYGDETMLLDFAE